MIASLQSDSECSESPAVPHALNFCIACHSGNYPGAPAIPFDDSKAFCHLIQTQDHDLLSDVDVWIKSDDADGRMPKDSAPLSKNDHQAVLDYLANSCQQ